jgi:hypothetical protein
MLARGGRGGQAESSVRARAESAAILARAVDPQHAHIAGGLVASGVRIDLVERAPAAGAESLANAGVPARRPAAGVARRPSIALTIASNLAQAAGPEPCCLSQVSAASRSARALSV